VRIIEMTTDQAVYHPDFDLGDFRFAVARYAKLLIRARWKSDPGFLSRQHLLAWGLQDIESDQWVSWKLLDQAAGALGILNMEYLPRCGSGGIRETDESTPAGRLISAVVGLAQVGDGGGPEHNGALREAARLLRDGKGVDWRALVAWDSLEAIRPDLDQLPHPRRQHRPEARLDRIEDLLNSLVEREQIKDFYSVEEFAGIVGKAEFTCREWCRLGRIKATKKHSGRGKYQAWAVSHDELLRYRKEGLLSVLPG
jgi:hypothetical protein